MKLYFHLLCLLCIHFVYTSNITMELISITNNTVTANNSSIQITDYSAPINALFLENSSSSLSTSHSMLSMSSFSSIDN